MGAGKNPYLRYRIIHSCLSSRQHNYWTIGELVARLADHDLQVDKRSVERDIEAMRYDTRLNYNAPIVYDRKAKGYCYTDRSFSLDRLPLTEDDLRALTLATNILHQYRGAQVVSQFEGVVDKLGQVVEHLRQPQNKKLIAFEHAPYYKGHDFFDAVLQAITDQQPLRIVYRKFDGTKNDEHLLHPYFLKEYRGRWYLLGYSEARHYVLTLGLDRFVSLAPATVAFRENKTLKPKAYFEHTLGVTLGKGAAEDVDLWFSAALAPYIKTQHLHHTQKTLREDESGLVIRLKLISNPELLSLILSYGADVRVLGPEVLKEKVRNVVGEMRILNEQT